MGFTLCVMNGPRGLRSWVAGLPFPIEKASAPGLGPLRPWAWG